MRTHPIRVSIRLSEEEHKNLINLVNRSGLNKSSYIRHLINGVVPIDTPSDEYYKAMKHLYYISGKLSEMCLKYEQKEEFIKFINSIDETIKLLTNAVVLPKKLGIN